MMDWNSFGMMNGGSIFFGSIIWVVAFIDLVLLGFLLWKQVRKR